MSSGNKRAFSKHSESSPNLPFWGSLREASSTTGSPELSTKVRFHIEALERCSLLALLVGPEEVLSFFFFFLLSSRDSGFFSGWLLR